MILFLMGMNPIQRLKLKWLSRARMVISHLVALSENRVIGVNNGLPWKLKRDLRHFSLYTQKKAVVMGRKTFESIGQALPNRKNIVISSTLEPVEGIEITENLHDAMHCAQNWNLEHDLEDEVVLIGGGYVFEESMPIVNKLILTRVDCIIDGDIFYPKINFSDWRKVSEESYGKDTENEYDFLIQTYYKN